MKFARYLQDTQTPEWKKAYIDYRGLKKLITVIRKTREGLAGAASPTDIQDEQAAGPSRLSDATEPDNNKSETQRLSDETISSQRIAGPSRQSDVFERDSDHDETPRPSDETVSSQRISNRNGTVLHPSFKTPPKPPPIDTSGVCSVQDGQARRGSTRGRRSSFAQAISIAGFRKGPQSFHSRMSSGQSRLNNPLAALPLHDLLSLLSPQELAFFTALDAQLEKIESFYTAREAELQARTKLLHVQLDELSDHKKLVQAAHPKTPLSWSAMALSGIKGRFKPKMPRVDSKRSDTKSMQSSVRKRLASILDSGEKGKEKESDGSGEEDGSPGGPKRVALSSDPEDYLYAKKKLKKAVLEHYRGLEMLHNYRILNLTGFRKALKKFEKTSRIPAQRQYMTERVEKSAFASDSAVRTMMKDMQDLYATVFVRGDKKRAMARLRAGSHVKSHHFSAFKSGAFMGLALPALIAGLYQSFQEDTREDIPGWDGLMFIYAIILVPVLFSALVGVNLLVWSRSRINYVFIFELDTRTRLDYREYYETPSILLAALCYAFWLSFAQIGAPTVSPTVWPLVWLGFAAFIMIDPLPILFKPSRYWLIRNVGKLLISGTRRVEFTDFWMGDQFCSLVFTLSNLYLFACVYAHGLDETWRKCGSSNSHWYLAFLLASLPLFVRLVQSIRRYADSKLATHLINGGKYASGIVSYFFFYLWRHQGSGRNASFVLWLVFNTLYSVYATSWDFIMDWSFLKIRSPYPLLRPELVYTNNIALYYVAIVTNVLIRFIWILYIPHHEPNIYLRTFIAGMLEMLRRWQWNFYRLENEHLGNMDQYRVTREVPLPYSFDDAYAGREDDNDDGDEDVLPRR